MSAPPQPPDRSRHTEVAISLSTLVLSYLAFLLGSVPVVVAALILGGVAFGIVLNRP